VEATTTALWVGSALRFELEPAAFVAAWGTVLFALALIDLEHRRIPNVIVLPSTAGAFAWVLGAGVGTSDWELVVRSVACGAGFFAVLFVIAMISGGMGFGDVKLGALIGVVTGRFSVGVALAGALGGFFIGGLVAVALLLSGKKGRKDAVPFGPSMAAGAVAALFAGERLVRTWLGM
jgi:leader peptidase (prepilin peptidase)/N-methyltransferase